MNAVLRTKYQTRLYVCEKILEKITGDKLTESDENLLVNIFEECGKRYQAQPDKIRGGTIRRNLLSYLGAVIPVLLYWDRRKSKDQNLFDVNIIDAVNDLIVKTCDPGTAIDLSED